MMKLEKNIFQTRIVLRLMDKIMKFEIDMTSFLMRTIMVDMVGMTDMNNFRCNCRTASLFNFDHAFIFSAFFSIEIIKISVVQLFIYRYRMRLLIGPEITDFTTNTARRTRIPIMQRMDSSLRTWAGCCAGNIQTSLRKEKESISVIWETIVYWCSRKSECCSPILFRDSIKRREKVLH